MGGIDNIYQSASMNNNEKTGKKELGRGRNFAIYQSASMNNNEDTGNRIRAWAELSVSINQRV